MNIFSVSPCLSPEAAGVTRHHFWQLLWLEGFTFVVAG